MHTSIVFFHWYNIIIILCDLVGQLASLALRWSNAKYEFWIGATDAYEEGEWRWAAFKRRLRDGFQVRGD